MTKILGLDLGTNSIGWAVIEAEQDSEGKTNLKKILSANSRIIPMSADQLGNFDKGNKVSQTADRTAFRGVRRLNERFKLRRQRLLRVLDKLNYLPPHYSESLTRYGDFKDGVEVLFPWKPTGDGKHEFLFQTSFNEMLADFAKNNPNWVANDKKIPYAGLYIIFERKLYLRKLQIRNLHGY